MSTFYDPGPIPGWPVGRPTGSNAGPAEIPGKGGQPEAPGTPGTPSTPGTLPAAPAAATSTAKTSGILNERSGRGAEAEARVRALRDAILESATRLQAGAPVSLREFYTGLHTACMSLEAGDLGSDGVTIGQQFEAFFERMRSLAEAHPEPVPTTALGLDADARFLHDMAEYLTSNYALDAEG